MPADFPSGTIFDLKVLEVFEGDGHSGAWSHGHSIDRHFAPTRMQACYPPACTSLGPVCKAPDLCQLQRNESIVTIIPTAPCPSASLNGLYYPALLLWSFSSFPADPSTAKSTDSFNLDEILDDLTSFVQWVNTNRSWTITKWLIIVGLRTISIDDLDASGLTNFAKILGHDLSAPVFTLRPRSFGPFLLFRPTHRPRTQPTISIWMKSSRI
jgi:hypothetical protein